MGAIGETFRRGGIYEDIGGTMRIHKNWEKMGEEQRQKYVDRLDRVYPDNHPYALYQSRKKSSQSTTFKVSNARAQVRDTIKNVRFIDSLEDYYGPQGIYKHMFETPPTTEEYNKALDIYLTGLKKLGKENEFEGDSLDRERLRDILFTLKGKTDTEHNVNIYFPEPASNGDLGEKEGSVKATIKDNLLKEYRDALEAEYKGIDVSKLSLVKDNGFDLLKLPNGDVLIEASQGEIYAKEKWKQQLKNDKDFLKQTILEFGGVSSATEPTSSDIEKLASELYDINDNGYIYGFTCDVLPSNGNDTPFYIIRAEGNRSIV